jgi:amino acid transporter
MTKSKSKSKSKKNGIATEAGNFAANAGTALSTIGFISSIIMGIIMVIIAIFLFIHSASLKVLKSPGSQSQEKCDSNDCPSGYYCGDDFTCKPYTADQIASKKHVYIGIGIGLLVFSILIIVLSWWWKNFVHHNRTAAQLNAGMFAFDQLRNI